MDIREKLTSKQARKAIRIALRITGFVVAALAANECIPRECGKYAPFFDVASELGGSDAE